MIKIIILHLFFIATAVYMSNSIFDKRSLKRKNNWYIENNNITYVDTEVARLKDKMVIKQYWFIPTIIVEKMQIL